MADERFGAIMRWSESVARHRHFMVPVAFLLLVVVLVVPLPPAIMDVLLASNIALAAVILLTTIYMTRPLEFSAFPALLLGTTLFRLVLNVASTRLVLSADASSAEGASLVAGHVINAFGTFVAGDSIIVGAIIFLILIIVQFVVITKGATRMSEVAARFTLDAMPGKQMAIDADLSAGLITEPEARTRREQVTAEADFYGAMDGASKFVRGDAIAGIIITLVNVLGGFAIGALEKGWGIAESLEVFTRLTIGDGLSSQIPAFIIAIAAGLIVARSSDRQRIGDQVPAQLASQPMALFLIAGFLALLSLTPLPAVPMIGSALVLAGTGWVILHRARTTRTEKEDAARSEAAQKQKETAPVEDLLTVDALELEIGYGLVSIVSSGRTGNLLERIAAIRRQLAVDLGIVMPPVRIRDNMQLDANAYHVRLRGATIGEGTIYPDLMMAMDSGLASGRLEGISAKEPAFGLPAVWIDNSLTQRAESMNYTVVDATSVVATHLTELVRSHASELLSRQEVSQLLEQLKKQAPKLVEDIIPGVVKVGDLQKVLQNLLRERVPIRDLELIVETLGDWAPHTRDLGVLSEYVRNALRRTIVSAYAEPDEKGRLRLRCIAMDPALIELIEGYIDRSPAGTSITMPEPIAAQLVRAVSSAATPLVSGGHQLIILTSPSVRAQLKEILDRQGVSAVVLSYNEIPRGLDVESMALVQSPMADEYAVGAA